ncbi:hypothetical protein LV84_00330 [Algoriphagus ratkowskyi]|uniref:Uncharacterized protein n=2 Tax=Algoriphagus ratkowskyi TaxID=57028 RepID=A0A2W7TDG1_9BACT|nr:hypothetical protein LV84_00330 [Algoriphagus ratkowskyi]
MQEFNGGLTWLALAGAVALTVALEALMNPKATIDAMSSGWGKAEELEKYSDN